MKPTDEMVSALIIRASEFGYEDIANSEAFDMLTAALADVPEPERGLSSIAAASAVAEIESLRQRVRELEDALPPYDVLGDYADTSLDWWVKKVERAMVGTIEEHT